MRKVLFVGLAAALMLSTFVGIASAHDQVGVAAQKLTDTHTVTVTASALPKLSVTMPAGPIDFGAVEPGVVTAPQSWNITVHSNRPITITRGPIGGDATAMGMSVSGDANTAAPIDIVTLDASPVFTDSATLSIPYTTPADQVLNATIQYTIVQQ